ncbi:hypothetical protein AB5J62_04495 [Amycolatopsis sp. cg5]|uniref:Rv3212 family protein n=1 Tax=Amycolatopsis sp. cg5 TaxID=3238802 RepID=UPI0035261386
MSEPFAGGNEGGKHRHDLPVLDYGIEDVLANQGAMRAAPKHAVKARKSPWNRKRDRLIALGIAVAVLVAALVNWLTSDNRATSSTMAEPPAGLSEPPQSVPGSLTEIWQAPSSATPVPIGEGNSVVTADGGEVDGRDPQTGAIRWHYARDLPLCTVALAGSRVNAAYRKDTGCSEVTQLDPGTGRRTAQRNGDAELGTQLLVDGNHTTTTGKKLLNVWREDLVKSMEYGEVPAIVNPQRQPRTGCTYGSTAVGSGKVGVIERCAGDPADRFTVFKDTGDDADAPKVVFSSVLAGRSAKVIAMTGDFAAIALPEQKLLVIYGADGNQRSAYPLQLPDSDLAQDPPGGAMITSRTQDGIYWFTGSKTTALSAEDLTPRWTLDSATGPGSTFAGQLVVPIKGGLAVLNEDNGSTVRTIGVDRRGYTGPVRLSSVGPVLLEQRGNTLAALR